MQIKRIYGLNFRILFEKRISSLRKKCWGAQWGRLYIICLNLWKMFCDRKNVSCLNFEGGKKEKCLICVLGIFYIVWRERVCVSCGFEWRVKMMKWRKKIVGARNGGVWISYVWIFEKCFVIEKMFHVWILKGEKKKSVWYVCWVFFYIVYANEINIFQYFLKNIRYKNTFERHILTYESWIRISQNQYPLCSDLYVGNAHCEFCRNWKNFFLKNELMKCVTYFFHIVYAHQINFLEFKCNV